MHSEKTILFLCLLHLLYFHSFGQKSNICFEQYTISDGLSDNSTTAILQDSRGFIWIGTSQGLCRYDGRNFRKYTSLGENGLTDLKIHTLAEDQDGNIWIGTQFGLNRFNPKNEVITQYHMGNGPGTIPYKWCNYLYVDKEKTLWLSTEKGLSRYDKPSNTFINYPIQVFGGESKINKFISKIFEDSKGRFWLTTSFGISLFDRTTCRSKNFIYDKTFKKGIAYPVMSITEDWDGNIWAGTWNDGLLKFDETEKLFKIVEIPGISFQSLAISDLTVMKLNKVEYLLLTTDAGLLLIDVRNQMNATFSLPDDNLENFCIDNQGNLWITGFQGLYKLIQNSLAFNWIHLPGQNNRTTVYHIIPDINNPDHLFYLSTINGWWQFDRRTNHIVSKILPEDPNRLITTINHWLIDASAYWFTSMNGLGYFNPYENKLIDLTHQINEETTYKFTQYIYEDPYKRLWISIHRSGLLVFDRKENKSWMLFANNDDPDNILGSDFRDMVNVGMNKVYFAANYKLYEVNADDFSYHCLELPEAESRIDNEKTTPDNLCVTPDNKLFVSSKLQVFEYNEKGFRKVFPKHGFPDFQIEKMYSAGGGTLWINTSRGVYKTDTSFKHLVHINSRLSWPDHEHITEVSFCKDGTVMFAAPGKIGILTDSLLRSEPVPPKVVVSKIKHGKTVHYIPDDDDYKIHLSFKESLEIELATVNYFYEKEARLFYRLEGWGEEIYEHQGRSSVFYQQLPPGTYRFRTWQQNAEGVEGAEAGFSFVIHSPFYLTWWFILLNIAFVSAAYYLFSRYQIKKSLELERLRTRIATDLHDDIGATLSAISLYADTLKNQVDHPQPQLSNILTKIGESSREMVNSMSDIVWAINPANDFGETFVNRMRNYAADVCQAKDILMHFSAGEHMDAMRLPLELRKNLYLIFKESLNNAVKYSRAQNIYIKLSSQGNTIYLSVSDNGIGFEPGTVNKGNGLKNIYSRAEMIGGHIKLSSVLGEGTTIEMWVKKKIS